MSSEGFHLPPLWETPEITEIERLPMHTTFHPCHSAAAALGFDPRKSKWVRSLNGSWNPRMRNAHWLSRVFNIDPLYSASAPWPEGKHTSLYASEEAEGPKWLYHWGEVEAHLLARMRQESFAYLQVAHPGRFRGVHSVLYARRAFEVPRVPRKAQGRLYACGAVLVKLNGAVLLRTSGSMTPRAYALDLTPHLIRGKNQLSVRAHAVSEPPGLLLASGLLCTDAAWSVSVDASNWEKPACYPVMNHRQFPHQECLPAETLLPRRRTGETFDFGVEVLGRAQVSLAGRPRRVRFWPGESLAEAYSKSLEDREQVIDAIQTGPHTYSSEAEMALRYLRVEASSSAKVKDVRMALSALPCTYRGAFACSDDRLNRIWMHAAYTLRLCMREFFIDGPKRDRLPWGGDLYLGLQSNAYAFAEKRIVERSLTVLSPEDPAICDVNGIIDYSLWWVIALRDYVRYFGDLDYLVRARYSFLRTMDAMETREGGDGFLARREGQWLFLDWSEIDKEGTSSCLQWIYVMALEAAADLCRWGGDVPRAQQWARKAQALRQRARRQFWNPAKKCFVDNSKRGRRGVHVSRHANFLAALAGAAPWGQIGPVLRERHLPPVGTPYMMALELRALALGGDNRLMLDRIRKYWGGMLEQDATTFWEGHDAALEGAAHYAFYKRPFGKSLCHAWSAGPVFLLSGELLGLHPLEPGWRRFSFEPNLGGLDWIAATVPTPHGDIMVDMEKGRVNLRAPKGVEVVRGLPRHR